LCAEKGESSLDSKIKRRAVKIAKLAAEKKAIDTVVIELKDLSTIADYFVICSGENPAQIKAIVESIEGYFSKKKIFPIGREGADFLRWVLIDYGDIVVHVFDEETREYYNLEKFWMDAPKVPIDKE
jgi:ribosome-associated protein